ncbi:Imm1 family immunity protein [Streptomyces sp. NPDC048521]|uniref:Imm1 family immunity protein n=1 Tax=Streptomyces sp. NPDC048521 TaxID=3365566 RepID=UPI00372079B9
MAFRGDYLYAEGQPEISAVIDRVMSTMRGERTDVNWISAGDDAIFSFADSRHTNDTFDWWPDNYLHVAANPTSGYGALIWYVDAERAERAKDGISDYTWVSDNENPPAFDPRVVRDPAIPEFHDPRSTIPIPLVRKAVEEFCGTATGDRPRCVHWVRSSSRGERIEQHG